MITGIASTTSFLPAYGTVWTSGLVLLEDHVAIKIWSQKGKVVGNRVHGRPQMNSVNIDIRSWSARTGKPVAWFYHVESTGKATWWRWYTAYHDPTKLILQILDRLCLQQKLNFAVDFYSKRLSNGNKGKTKLWWGNIEILWIYQGGYERTCMGK